MLGIERSKHSNPSPMYLATSIALIIADTTFTYHCAVPQPTGNTDLLITAISKTLWLVE
jgi:hypothetical protein